MFGIFMVYWNGFWIRQVTNDDWFSGYFIW